MLSRVGLRPIYRFSRPVYASRFTSTVKASYEQEQELLTKQRLHRPVSPHLNIYQPQLTWLLSAGHRITAVVLSGAFYAITVSYAATSLLNIPFSSASIVSAAAALPLVGKLVAKAAMAYPFVFHTANGIRHLVWDFGKQLTIPGVYRTGYAVLAATAAFGTYFLVW